MDLSFLDWINPLDGLVGRARHGDMHRFTFDAQCQHSGKDVEILLRRYGVHIWGRKVGPDAQRSFLVKRSQAEWAEYVLCRAGIPLTGPLLDPRNAQYAVAHAQDSMPTPWNQAGVRPRSFVDRLVDGINRVIP